MKSTQLMKKSLFFGFSITIGASVGFWAGSQAIAALAPVNKAVEPARPADWEVYSDEDGIKTWRKEVEGSPVVAFKGEAIVDASVAKIAQVLYDTSKKTEWVAKAVETKDVRPISEFERIEYNHTATPFVLKDRDFVFNAKLAFDVSAKVLAVQIHSVEDGLMPERSNLVRGKLYESVYTMSCIDDCKRSKVTVEIHADPMGAVPKWIVNLFQKSWPRKTLEGIKRQAAKPDLPELKLVNDVFSGSFKGEFPKIVR